MKKTVLVTLIMVGVVFIGVLALGYMAMIKDNESSSTPASTSSESSVPETSSAQTTTASPVTTQDGVAPTCVAGASCTREVIATHNTQNDCWVIYEGMYYDVTSYIDQHKGGSAVFNNDTCGKDIAAYLSGQASTAGERQMHSSSDLRDLVSLKLGTVSN